ncbi:MAG: hypothetical protein OHK005_00760 [Candidatus Methylacidiphilales bacterium]
MVGILLMKRGLLAFAAVVGSLVLGAAVAGTWLHWYMEQPAFIEEIRSALVATSGGEVEFEHFRVRGLNGIEVTGLQVNPRLASGGSMKAASARVTFSIWALATGRVDVNQVHLRGMEMFLQPSPSGEWPTFFSGVKPVVQVAGWTLPVTLNLTQVRLERSRAEIRAAGGEVLALVEDLDAEAGLSLVPGWTDASGWIRADRLRFGSGLRLTNVSIPIRLANRVITMNGVRAFCHGGTAEASVTGQFNRGVPGFEIQLALRDVDLTGLLEDLGARTGWAQGTLNLDAKAEGTLTQAQLAQGIGRLSIESAGITTLDVLGTLGQTLGFSDLRTPRFEKVTGEFKIGDQRITFYNLEGVSPLIELSGAGYVDFDGQMDFDMLLGLHPEIGDRMPAHISANFNRRADQFRLITFKLSGPISNPTSNLPRKLFAGPGDFETALVRVR